MADKAAKKGFDALGLIGLCFWGYVGWHYFTYGTLPLDAQNWFSSGASTARAPAKPREVVRTSAVELFNEYAANEVATDERLKGKDVIVVGRVESINKNVWGTIYVSLQTPNQFMSAHMNLDDADKNTAAALRKGQRVEVRCKKMQRWAGSPSGHDCRLQSTQ
jgi:tRNA_anti-like